MHRDRMELLVRVLDDVEASGKRFNMGTWFDPPNDGISCGTSACALGWAALDPRFHELGLHMAVDYEEDGESHTYRCTTLEQIYAYGDSRSIEVMPEWDGFTGYEAAISLFDISDKAACYIFNPSRYPSVYPTIAAVRNRVLRVMEHEGQSPDEDGPDEDGKIEDEDDQATPTEGFV